MTTKETDAALAVQREREVADLKAMLRRLWTQRVADTITPADSRQGRDRGRSAKAA
jgi:hypothetical protein